MGRAIISSQSSPQVSQGFSGLAKGPPPGGSVPPQKEEDTYKDRLFKYIPAEVVTLYLALSAIVTSAQDAPHFLTWAIFFVGLIGTPIYLRSIQNVSSKGQLLLSTLAFAVWIFGLGGPFADFAWYKQIYGALLLPTFTFFVACIPTGQPKAARG